jgi:hypothetical protein
MPSRQELRDHDLLSPSAYDDDVTSPRSLSEQDSDSEDDEFLRANRSSMELARHDKTVLEEEDEMEKLLVRSGPADGLRRIFSPTSGPVRIGKRDRSRRRERKRSIQGKPHQEGDLMFEMEEGFREFSDNDSIDSLNLDEKDADDWQEKPVSQVYGSRTYNLKLILNFYNVAQKRPMCATHTGVFSHRRSLPDPPTWRIQGF